MRVIVLFLFMTSLLGCASSQKAAVQAGLTRGSGGEVMSATLGTRSTIPDLTLEQLIEANHKLAQALLDEVTDATILGHAANGLLLISTLNVAKTGGLGETGQSVSDEVLLTLGLSQGIRYADPQVAAEAFSIAADKSACIASQAASLKNRGANREELRSVLWEMTVRVQTDLRRNLIRPNLSVTGVVANILGRNTETELAARVSILENQLRATQSRAQIEADLTKDVAKKDARYLLLGCFVAGGTASKS